MDRHDFIPNLRVGELAHIFVVLTMIAKIVSGFIDCPDIIRVRFYPAAGHEKRGMYVVFGQNFQNTWGIVIAPGGIKGNGNLWFLCVYAVDGKFFSVDSIADGNRTVGHLKINC